jgi:hypothetical protein
VIKWEGFAQLVVEWKSQFYLTNNTATYEIPRPLLDTLVGNTNAALHSPVMHNVLKNVAKVMDRCDFVGRGVVRCFITTISAATTTATTALINAALCGADCYCLMKNDPSQILFPVEVRGRWTLGDAQLWDPTSCSSQQISAVTQLYNYMVVAGCIYGVITSYDAWWFAYRTADGDFYISKAYSKDSIYPSVLECIAYLCSKGPAKCDQPPFVKSDIVLPRLTRKRSGEYEDGDENTNSKRWKGGDKDDENDYNDKTEGSNEFNNELGDTFSPR